ncbi:MAG: hypothetical protein KDD70_15595 [Bdellovibrionales bacterium]|nr:hypothetical protein [Bdellovibrionales bacterium]
MLSKATEKFEIALSQAIHLRDELIREPGMDLSPFHIKPPKEVGRSELDQVEDRIKDLSRRKEKYEAGYPSTEKVRSLLSNPLDELKTDPVYRAGSQELRAKMENRTLTESEYQLTARPSRPVIRALALAVEQSEWTRANDPDALQVGTEAVEKGVGIRVLEGKTFTVGRDGKSKVKPVYRRETVTFTEEEVGQAITLSGTVEQPVRTTLIIAAHSGLPIPAAAQAADLTSARGTKPTIVVEWLKAIEEIHQGELLSYDEWREISPSERRAAIDVLSELLQPDSDKVSISDRVFFYRYCQDTDRVEEVVNALEAIPNNMADFKKAIASLKAVTRHFGKLPNDVDEFINTRLERKRDS